METGELDHVEADFLRLCGSKCYLFLLADGHEFGMREFLACDPDMREIRRFRLPPLPTEGIKFWYDMPAVLELRQPTKPGVLLSVDLHPAERRSGVSRMIRYLFFDQECRTLLWQHEAVQDSEFGISPPYLMDGYIVRPLAKGAELINTVTGEASEIRTGERVPIFYPANGWWFGTSPGEASSLYEDPPSHVFWREFDGAPLCCGVVVDSATASSALPPPSVPPALPAPPAARKRKKPDPGIPVVSERAEGVHILCTKTSELSPQLKAFGQWLAFFRKGGVNLHGYIYDPEGPADFSDAALKQMGHTREEIKCVRLAATDDWHDPAALAADLRRCEGLVPEKPANSKSRKWILRELEQLIALSDKAAAAGDKVQLLAPPADCEDEDDWFGESEDDEDDEDDE
ncbi:MAG: hypothetical protein J0M04_08170 [Verrucomicrobia bacterium]|nr:hypothetical protein [Verrucomicrobiota bacterium]